MNLHYTMDETQLTIIRDISTDAASAIVWHYSDSFRAAQYIFKMLFNISHISVDFISEDKYYDLVINTYFKVTSKVGDFTLILSENSFKIISDKNIYSFNLALFYPNSEIALKEFVDFQKDRIIVERFNSHKIELEVHFKFSGKVHYLEIPLDTDYTIDLEMMRMIKGNASLNDLKKFYMKLFYNRQSVYDKKSSITTLSIWQKLNEFDNYISKGIKLDEATLENGFIQNLQLGNVYFTGDNTIIILWKDGVYTIRGFTNQDCSLDFNKEFRELLERKKKLNS